MGDSRPLWERFWEKVEFTGFCWNWTGSGNGHGYGRIRAFGRKQVTHRVAYELLVGPIPDGLELDHLCRNKACVNPDHLEPVTHSENNRRGWASKSGVKYPNRGGYWRNKTHCTKGHEYTEENTYVNARNQRICRECARINKLARYHRTKVLKGAAA